MWCCFELTNNHQPTPARRRHDRINEPRIDRLLETLSIFWAFTTDYFSSVYGESLI